VDAFEILERIRAFSDVPVLMLSAAACVGSRVRALELGADDFLAMPFDIEELVARARAILRRLDIPTPPRQAPSFRSGDLEVDYDTHEVRLAGRPVDLTPTEYRVLYHLVRNPGYVLRHGTLIEKVWGPGSDSVDLLRVSVGRLREKLKDDAGAPRYIRTERGLGYRFVG
jgi:two-component system KDP operon response regulator KdpE